MRLLSAVHGALIVLAMGCSVGDDTSNQPPAQSCQGEDKEYAGRCYRFVTTPMNWEDARNHCLGLGSYSLVTIDGKEEEEWLHVQETALANDQWWIGYTDADSEGTWRWTSGSSSTYTNWSKGNPDNYTNGPTRVQNCTNDNYKYSDGQWDDNDCLKTYPFICER